MREMRFRGKDFNGEWVYGSLIVLPDKILITGNDNGLGEHTYKSYRVDPATVGQFTGLRDIQRTEEFPDGQEIYEGDVLQSQVGDNHIWRVLFEDGSFVLEQINGLKRRGQKKHAQDFCCEDDIYLYQLVVVGNVHDNPELLEVGEQ